MVLKEVMTPLPIIWLLNLYCAIISTFSVIQYDPRKVIYGMVIHEYAKYKNNIQCLQSLVDNNQTYETDISKAVIKGAT